MSNTYVSITGSNLPWTSGSSWRLVDSRSFVDSEAVSTTLSSTIAYSNGFTASACTASAIAIKISQYNTVAAGAQLTMSLVNAALTVLGTGSINLSDIANSGGTVAYNHGWYCITLNPPVILNGTTGTFLGLNETPSGNAYAYSSTGTNWSRMLVTNNNTNTPTTNDQLHIIGTFTGPGQLTSSTVIMNNNTTMSYGPVASNTLYTEGITIGRGGTLQNATASNSNTYLNWKGIFQVFDSGSLIIGTQASPIPSSSIAIYEMSSSVNVDTGFFWDQGSTVIVWGQKNFNTSSTKPSMTSTASENHFTYLTSSIGGWCSTSGTGVTGSLYGQAESFAGFSGSIIDINGTNYTCSTVTGTQFLTTTTSTGTNYFPTLFTHSASAATLNVVNTQGWNNGDLILVTDTSNTSTQCETASIQSVNSINQITITSPLIYAHQGVAPTQAEVGNLTRNVIIRGIGSGAPDTTNTLQGYIFSNSINYISLNFAQFNYLGSATANKLGIDVTTTTGTFVINFCSLYYFWITGAVGININTSVGSITISNNIFYNINSSFLSIVATVGYHTITNNLFSVIASIFMIFLNDIGSILNGNTFVGTTLYGIYCAETNFLGSFSNNTFHSLSYPVILNNIIEGSIDNLTIWRSNAAVGASFTQCLLNITNMLSFATDGVQLTNCSNTSFLNSSFSGDYIYNTYEATNGLILSSINQNINIISCSFGTGSYGIQYKNNIDLDIGGDCLIYINLNNTILASPYPIFLISNALIPSSINCQSLNGIPGNHITYTPVGNISNDTKIYRTATPSMRLAPINGSAPLTSSYFMVPVSSGSAASASVYIRTSLSGSSAYDTNTYNGQSASLWLQSNNAVGIQNNILLATSSNASGSSVQLTGITPVVIDNCVLNFYLTVGGSNWTQGWINVDDFSSPTVNDTKGFTYYQNGEPVVYADNTSGNGVVGNTAFTYWS